MQPSVAQECAPFVNRRVVVALAANWVLNRVAGKPASAEGWFELVRTPRRRSLSAAIGPLENLSPLGRRRGLGRELGGEPVRGKARAYNRLALTKGNGSHG